MVYKRVSSWTSGRSFPFFNFVKYPHPGGTGHEAVQKDTPYQHGVQKYRNTSASSIDVTPLHTKNAEMKYYTVMTAIWPSLK